MRLKFREAQIKRLESVASGKISAETHLLKEREEHLKVIEVLHAQVDRNQEVTRFAMENLRLKEEIRRQVFPVCCLRLSCLKVMIYIMNLSILYYSLRPKLLGSYSNLDCPKILESYHT